MASYHVIRTARLTDRQVLDLIFALKNKLEIVSANVELGVSKSIQNEMLIRDSELIQKLDRDSYYILNAEVSTTSGITIIFQRGISTNTQDIHSTRTASPYYDEIALTRKARNNESPDIDEFIECMDIVQDSLPKIFPLEKEGIEQSVVENFQAELTTLTSEYRQLLKGLDSERVEFRRIFEEERQKANEYY